VTALIEGKVARVLSGRQIIINRGSEQGVQVGMRFAVLDLRAADVRDPDTNEPLGSLFFEKVRVEVVQVEPKLALAQTFQLVPPSQGSLLGVAGLFGQSARYVTFHDPEAADGPFDESKSIVKRGDSVRLIPPPQPPKGKTGDSRS
jgi:hypothetical protein